MNWAYIGLALGVLIIIGKIALVLREARKFPRASPLTDAERARYDDAVRGP